MEQIKIFHDKMVPKIGMYHRKYKLEQNKIFVQKIGIIIEEIKIFRENGLDQI